MPDPRYDESEHAAAVARIIDSDHSTLDCHPDPAQDLQRLITQLGLPFGDSSLLPAYWVSKAAREHVTVALTGDGGDELFIGYERQMAYFPFERWKWALAAVPLWALRARDPKSMTSKARRMVEAARADDLQTLGHIFMRTDLHRLFKGTRFPVPSVDGFERCIEHVLGRALGRFFPSIQPGFGFELCRVLRYLSEDLLVKADTASMAAALEARAPFLDTDLAAAVHAANPLDLIPDGERKGLLREVARRYLPAAIVDRPKMGFAIPIGKWFRTDYGGMRTLLLDHLHSAEPFGSVPLMPGGSIDLNKRAIRQMLDEHLGTGLSGMFRRDHSQRLYMLLVLSIWAKWLGSLR
jgi:asparagine synthase (glutamine-hydrolysing)